MLMTPLNAVAAIVALELPSAARKLELHRPFAYTGDRCRLGNQNPRGALRYHSSASHHRP